MGEVIAGLGLRPGCGVAEAVALVRRAAGDRLTAVAVPDFREAQGHAIAAVLGVPVLVVEAAALAAVQNRCQTRSAVAARAVGVPSVAEGAALAAAGPHGRLVVARIASARATCAVAEAP